MGTFSAESLPPGTMAYCTRRGRQVLARLPSGHVIDLSQAAIRPFNGHLFEPYGIAYDQKNKQFWLADKWSNAVWEFRVKSTSDGPKLDPIREHKVPEITAPCCIDVHDKYGVLGGCYGVCGARIRGVTHFDGKSWRFLVSSQNEPVSHCCWLPGGGYCYVTRSRSVLWAAETIDAAPRAITSPDNRTLSPEQGDAMQLRLRYVQGLYFSKKRNAVVIADANLGVIYELSLESGKYRTLAGKSRLGESAMIADVKPGTPKQWLGAIRALFEDGLGLLTWLDGQTSMLWALTNEDRISCVGSAALGGQATIALGTGIALAS